MHIFDDFMIMIVIIIVKINHQFSEPIIKDSVLKTQVSLVLCCVLLKDPADIETTIVFFCQFLQPQRCCFQQGNAWPINECSLLSFCLQLYSNFKTVHYQEKLYVWERDIVLFNFVLENDSLQKINLHLGKGLCLDRECRKVRLAVASPYPRAARSRPSWSSEK